MPEGDTVWLAGRRLDDALAGRRLTVSDFRVPALATVDLTGREVIEVVSRGKHLLTRLSAESDAVPLTLHSHFRMDGSWHLYRPGERWRGGPAWQVRAVLANAEWQAVGYRLPVLDLVPTAEEARLVGHLGPDLLGADWGPTAAATAVANLAADPDREIRQALLDQRNLAGLGNLYASEVCFLRGLSPWMRVADVPDLAALVDLSHRLLELNRSGFAQVTTGVNRRGESTWVFERAGRPCRRCRTPVASAEQGAAPYTRIVHWCPTCQPAPE